MEQPQCFPKGGLRRLQKRGEQHVPLDIYTEEGIRNLWTLNLVEGPCSAEPSSTWWVILNGSPEWLSKSLEKLEKSGWLEPYKKEENNPEGALKNFPTEYLTCAIFGEVFYDWLMEFADMWGMCWAQGEDNDFPMDAEWPLVHRHGLEEFCPWDRVLTEKAKQYIETPACAEIIEQLPWSPPYVDEDNEVRVYCAGCPCCDEHGWKLGRTKPTTYKWLCTNTECRAYELTVNSLVYSSGEERLCISLTEPPYFLAGGANRLPISSRGTHD
jgi:hypothetical protein